MVVIRGTLGLIEWHSKSPGTEYRVINTAHDLMAFIREIKATENLEIYDELITFLGKVIVSIHTDAPVYKESVAG